MLGASEREKQSAKLMAFGHELEFDGLIG